MKITLQNEKFLNGDFITTDNLNALTQFYEDLEKKLNQLDSSFHLALTEVQRRRTRLNDYQHARKYAKKSD